MDATISGRDVPRLGPFVPQARQFRRDCRQNTAMRFTLALVLLAPTAFAGDSDWSAYGGDTGGTRYSHLKQVTRENVGKLKSVWTYHTGALKPETGLNEKAAFEATPILVEGTLYLSTPFNRVIALDPGTGAGKVGPTIRKVSRSHDYSEVSSRGGRRVGGFPSSRRRALQAPNPWRGPSTPD